MAEALARLAADAKTDANLMAATLAAARAGATTGEWAGTLREVFGEFRAPTGVSAAPSASAEAGAELAEVRERVRETGEELGGRLRLLVGKPGPRRALQRRRAGRRTRPRRRLRGGLPGHPADPGADRRGRGGRGRALRRAVDPVSGSHMELVPGGAGRAARRPGIGDVPVIVGGIIPDADARRLIDAGRGRGLHAQGLRADRDHGRHRRRDPRGERPRLSPRPFQRRRVNPTARTSVVQQTAAHREETSWDVRGA